MAIIAEAESPSATRVLSERIGRLSCYNGGIRIYWPGLTLDDDVRRHPLLLESRIATIGAQRAERTLENSIFSVAAFRFVPDVRVDRIIGASEAASRAERIVAVRESDNSTWEEYAVEIAKDLDDAQAELTDLRAENANLRENQKVLFAFSEDDAAEQPGEVERTPVSVAEAVSYANEDCRNLLFLESAHQSAGNSPFKRPQEVYDNLLLIDKVAGVWNRNEGQGDLRQMLIDGGLGRRVSNFISDTTKGKYGNEYRFTYNGERLLFEPHVTLGAGSADTCASIHYLPDAAAGKIVVGHVGRHLSNTKT